MAGKLRQREPEEAIQSHIASTLESRKLEYMRPARFLLLLSAGKTLCISVLPHQRLKGVPPKPISQVTPDYAKSTANATGRLLSSGYFTTAIGKSLTQGGDDTAGVGLAAAPTVCDGSWTKEHREPTLYPEQPASVQRPELFPLASVLSRSSTEPSCCSPPCPDEATLAGLTHTADTHLYLCLHLGYKSQPVRVLAKIL